MLFNPVEDFRFREGFVLYSDKYIKMGYRGFVRGRFRRGFSPTFVERHAILSQRHGDKMTGESEISISKQSRCEISVSNCG